MVRFLYRKFLMLYNQFRGYNDYFSFPFNVNNPMPSRGNMVMRECCEALEKNNIKYYITDGTALGLYRQNGFIPHDTDIDVDIDGNACDFALIERVFSEDLKMHLGRKMSYKGEIQQLVFYTDDEIIFDMVFWRKEANKKKYKVHYPESPACVLDSKYFENVYFYEFEGKQYPLHAPIEEWLVSRYGKDWRIPKTQKGDWREECADFEK